MERRKKRDQGGEEGSGEDSQLATMISKGEEKEDNMALLEEKRGEGERKIQGTANVVRETAWRTMREKKIKIIVGVQRKWKYSL